MKNLNYRFVLFLAILTTCSFLIWQRWAFRGAEGVVFTGSMARLIMSGSNGSKMGMQLWTPYFSDVKYMEQVLPAYLKTKQKEFPNKPFKLTNYRRQYVGFIENGRKMIYINAFRGCDSKWRKFPVLIGDGGDLTFTLFYDVKVGKFDRFHYGLSNPEP